MNDRLVEWDVRSAPDIRDTLGDRLNPYTRWVLKGHGVGADPHHIAVERLSDRVRRIEESQQLPLRWPLRRMKGKAVALCEMRGLGAIVSTRLATLIDRVHGCLLRTGIEFLPPPELEQNPEATVDIIWFDRRNDASLGITILPPGDPEGDVWLHLLQGVKSRDIYNPSNEQIIAALKSFAGV